MNVMIFGGTTEGRELSHLLSARGVRVTVSVATDYGREEQGASADITVLTGRKDEAQMTALLRGMDLCVDATHPYAVEATRTIRAACAATRVPYRRLLRAPSESEGAVVVASAAEAADYLRAREGNILLTTGAKELCAFAALEAQRLYARVLPSHEGIAACEAAGIPHRNIIAMQGPFSREMNEAILRQYHILHLVTKDGGKAGGFAEKRDAAAANGVTLVLIRRPEEDGVSFDEIVSECEEMMTCR